MQRPGRLQLFPMPQGKKTSATGEHTDRDSQLDRLIAAVETVAMQLQVLVEAVDAIRDEFSWALNNDRFRSPPTSRGSIPVAPNGEAPDRENPAAPVTLRSKLAECAWRWPNRVLVRERLF